MARALFWRMKANEQIVIGISSYQEMPGQITNLSDVALFLQAEMARALFWRMKANGQIVIGISSYQEFPGQITNPFDDRHTTEADWEIYKACDGWLHCFRSV